MMARPASRRASRRHRAARWRPLRNRRLRVLARIKAPIWPGMMCSVRPQGRARAVDAEKLACARSVVTKRLALRAAAIRLNVGKIALSGLLITRISHLLLPTAERGDHHQS